MSMTAPVAQRPYIPYRFTNERTGSCTMGATGKVQHDSEIERVSQEENTIQTRQAQSIRTGSKPASDQSDRTSAGVEEAPAKRDRSSVDDNDVTDSFNARGKLMSRMRELGGSSSGAVFAIASAYGTPGRSLTTKLTSASKRWAYCHLCSVDTRSEPMTTSNTHDGKQRGKAVASTYDGSATVWGTSVGTT